MLGFSSFIRIVTWIALVTVLPYLLWRKLKWSLSITADFAFVGQKLLNRYFRSSLAVGFTRREEGRRQKHEKRDEGYQHKHKNLTSRPSCSCAFTRASHRSVWKVPRAWAHCLWILDRRILSPSRHLVVAGGCLFASSVWQMTPLTSLNLLHAARSAASPFGYVSTVSPIRSYVRPSQVFLSKI